MKPDIKQTVGGYQFTWGPEKLIIQVNRLHLHTDGRITAELLICNEENKPIYPPTDINFKADRTRSSLAKTLVALDETRPWVDIINQLSLLVVDTARKGEPVRELWTGEDVPDLEYLINPILIKGVPTVIFGDKGVAKSNISLVFYLCLTLPWFDNELGLGVPSKSVKTLILDYELPGYIAQRNLKKLVEGMSLEVDVPLYHRRCSAPLADDIEQVASHIADLNAEVLIIDSLARACGGELNKTEPANDFFEALDKLNVTSLILAQTSKNEETQRKSIYGNALFTYYARSIWELCKSDTLRDDVLDVALFHRWANLTKLHKDMGFRFNFNGIHTTVTSEAVSIAEFVGKVNVQKAILDILKRGALPVEAIAKSLGKETSNVSPLLTKLKTKGSIVNLGSGLWGLATHE